MSEPIQIDEDDPTALWVAEVNRLARKVDDYAAGVHPSALEGDPYFARLKQQYIAHCQGGEDAYMQKLKKRRARKKHA